MERVEMIISYTTDGTDYQYNDNHGLLIRCCQCIGYEETDIVARTGICARFVCKTECDDYCSKAVKK